MNLGAILNSAVCVRVVLALGHFLWQAAAIAVLAMAAVWMLRRSSANLRYVVLVAGLGLMAACPPVTFFLVGGPAADAAPAPLAGGTAPVVAPLGPTPAVTAGLPEGSSPPEGVPSGAAQPAELGAEPARPSASARLRWESVAPHLTLCYLVGVALMWVRLLLGLHGGRNLRKTSQPVTEGELLAALARQARRVGLRFTPAAAWCRRIVAPAVVGVLRPMILLPMALAGGLTAEQIESLLAHELAHIRRWDYLVNLVQRVIEAFLFFHPAVWLVSRRIRIEREHCCDDVAVAVGGRPSSYAASLLDLAERSLDAPRRVRGSLVALGAGGRSAGLRGRVLRLLGASSDDGMRLSRTWPVALALAALVAAGLAVYTCAGAGAAARDDEAAARALWKEKGSESYTIVARTIGPVGMHIEYRIRVAKGRAVSAERRMAPDPRQLDGMAFKPLPEYGSKETAERYTVAGLFRRAGELQSRDDPLFDRSIEYHPALGYPTKIVSKPKPGSGVRDGFSSVEVISLELDEAAAARKDRAAELVALSDLIVLGRVTAVHDYRHRNGGMGYDVEPERVLWGSHAGKSLRFRSGGAIGYAEYKKDERVLLFLCYRDDPPELHTVVLKGRQALCYVTDDAVKGPLGARPLDEYLALVERAAAAAQAKLLPGSDLSVAEALDTKDAFAAVCEAADEAHEAVGARLARGAFAKYQLVKVVAVLAGDVKPTDRALLDYIIWDTPGRRERAIRKGERVIWIGHTRNAGRLAGRKALADTPENRAAVAAIALPSRTEAVKRLVERWRATLDSFEIQIIATGPEDWGVRYVVLHVAPGPQPWGDLGKTATVRAARVTKEEAKRIVDHLLTSGLLFRVPPSDAAEHGWLEINSHSRRDRRGVYLAWGRDVWQEVGRLRQALTAGGAAARAVDKLLAKLEPYRDKNPEAAGAYRAAVREALAAELPGRDLSEASRLAVQQPMALRCTADSQALLEQVGGDLRATVQQYRFIETVAGPHPRETFEVAYLIRPGQRPVRQGETVLWLVGGRVNDVFWGIRALADAPDNRKAMLSAAEALAGPKDPDKALRPEAVLLPGSRLRLNKALAQGTLIAVCRAGKNDRPLVNEEGVIQHTHDFEVLETLPGSPQPAPAGRIDLHYTQFALSRLSLGRERAIKPGEKVIWIFRAARPGDGFAKGWVGVKALADTPANRAAIRRTLAWGLFIINGLQCRLLPQEQTVEVFEDAKPHEVRVPLTYELRNTTNRPILFLAWGTPLREGLEGRGSLSVVGPQGNKLDPGRTKVKPRPATKDDFVRIMPGQTLSARVDVYDLTQVNLTLPGKYSVKAWLYTREPPPNGREIMMYYDGDAEKARRNPDNVWVGSMASNTATFAVVARGGQGEAIDKQRDRLFAEADRDLRQGLLALSEQFPQLKIGNNRPLEEALKGAPGAGRLAMGRLAIHVGRGNRPDKAPYKPEQIDDSQTWLVNVSLQRGFYERGDGPSGWRNLYRYLRVGGSCHASAGDPKLDAALKKLLADALAPLAALDEQVGRSQPTSAPPAMPGGGAGADAQWGEAVGGLKCRLTAGQANVPMGAKVDFLLDLQFDPKTVHPKVGILDRTRPHVFKVTLTFTDTKSGKAFNRPAFDLGMIRPQVRVPLGDKPLELEPEKLEVYLLSDAGRQVPAGGYAVTAMCDVDPSRVQIDPPPKGVAWSGKIVSGPLPLVVTPVEPRAVNVKVPTSLIFLFENGGLAWDFDENDLAAVPLRVRPGFDLAYRLYVHEFLDGKPLTPGNGLTGEGSPYARLVAADRGVNHVAGDVANRVLAGGKLKVVADLQIIENSSPGRQGWRPNGPVIHKVRLEGVATKETVAGLGRQPEDVWGQAAGGLRTRLAVPHGAGPTGPLAGTDLMLFVRNVSDKKIAVDGMGQFKDPWQFLHVRKDGQADLPVHKAPVFEVDSWRIDAGHGMEVSTVDLARIADFGPGLYTLQWSVPAGKVPAGKRVPPPSNVLYLKVARRPDGRLIVTELPAPAKAS